VLVATVGGLGRIPWAPGTAGSVVGLALGLLLVRVVSHELALLLLGAAFVGAAWCCGQAERHLDQLDPPAVILDEVWGMCAVVTVWPLAAWSAPLTLAAFGLFRAFDILKPPPLPRLARWPGGWGIMADDLGAAAYTLLACWIVTWLIGWLA
jgi:phosphatidylglycerophosphatase A